MSLPLVEMPISTSPARPCDSTCRANIPSTPKSFAIAVSNDESVVNAIAGIDGRGLSIVKVLTNSVARCWASAALPPLPQISSLPPARNEAVRVSAAATTSSRQPIERGLHRARRFVQIGVGGAAEPFVAHVVPSRGRWVAGSPVTSPAMISTAAARSGTTWSASSRARSTSAGPWPVITRNVVAPIARPMPDVAGVVAHDERLRRIEPEPLGCLEGHARPRFATRAVVLGRMRAREDRIDRGALGAEHRAEAVVDRIELRGREQAATHVRLVRDDDDPEPEVLSQSSDRRGRAGDQHQFVGVGQVVDLGVDRAVAVEQREPAGLAHVAVGVQTRSPRIARTPSRSKSNGAN